MRRRVNPKKTLDFSKVSQSDKKNLMKILMKQGIEFGDAMQPGENGDCYTVKIKMKHEMKRNNPKNKKQRPQSRKRSKKNFVRSNKDNINRMEMLRKIEKAKEEFVDCYNKLKLEKMKRNRPTKYANQKDKKNKIRKMNVFNASNIENIMMGMFRESDIEDQETFLKSVERFSKMLDENSPASEDDELIKLTEFSAERTRKQQKGLGFSTLDISQFEEYKEKSSKYEDYPKEKHNRRKSKTGRSVGIRRQSIESPPYPRSEVPEYHKKYTDNSQSVDLGHILTGSFDHNNSRSYYQLSKLAPMTSSREGSIDELLMERFESQLRKNDVSYGSVDRLESIDDHLLETQKKSSQTRSKDQGSLTSFQLSKDLESQDNRNLDPIFYTDDDKRDYKDYRDLNFHNSSRESQEGFNRIIRLSQEEPEISTRVIIPPSSNLHRNISFRSDESSVFSFSKGNNLRFGKEADLSKREAPDFNMGQLNFMKRKNSKKILKKVLRSRSQLRKPKKGVTERVKAVNEQKMFKTNVSDDPHMFEVSGANDLFRNDLICKEVEMNRPSRIQQKRRKKTNKQRQQKEIYLRVKQADQQKAEKELDLRYKLLRNIQFNKSSARGFGVKNQAIRRERKEVAQCVELKNPYWNNPRLSNNHISIFESHGQSYHNILRSSQTSNISVKTLKSRRPSNSQRSNFPRNPSNISYKQAPIPNQMPYQFKNLPKRPPLGSMSNISDLPQGSSRSRNLGAKQDGRINSNAYSNPKLDNRKMSDLFGRSSMDSMPPDMSQMETLNYKIRRSQQSNDGFEEDDKSNVSFDDDSRYELSQLQENVNPSLWRNEIDFGSAQTFGPNAQNDQNIFNYLNGNLKDESEDDWGNKLLRSKYKKKRNRRTVTNEGLMDLINFTRSNGNTTKKNKKKRRSSKSRVNKKQKRKRSRSKSRSRSRISNKNKQSEDKFALRKQSTPKVGRRRIKRKGYKKSILDEVLKMHDDEVKTYFKKTKKVHLR